MNALTETQAVSAQTLEHVLGSGDLSKLSTQQRVEYYAKTCQTLGLNPLTRPFRFLALNGQIQLYATRDCTDQLRKVNGITLHVVDKQIDGDLFIVTVRARTKDGRDDEDVGAVTLGQLRGDSRANAIMKAMTKAKRRVTLSICGLGITDESELDTMPGAMAFDHDAPEPTNETRSMRAAAASIRRADKIAEKAPVYEAGDPPPPSPERTREQWQSWLQKLHSALAVLSSRAEVVELAGRKTVGDAIADGPQWVRDEISALLAEAYARFPEGAAPDEDPFADTEEDAPHIVGEQNVMAG